MLAKTPADGLLKVGDVIVGANGNLFQDTMDPRPALGYALAASQSPQLKGIITFHVVRGKAVINVDVNVGCTDYYSDTWPFDCRKSDLLRKQTVNVVVNNEGDRHDFWTPLFLVASGDEAKIARSVRAFGAYCGTNFPYGMGTGGAGRSGRMDNGMNGMAAIIYHLLGEEEMSPRWARSVCYMWMAREHGHAEGIFSIAWGPLAAALAPKEEFHMFMNEMMWHYELGRASDGGMMFLRKGRWDYPVNQTAAVGLFLFLPDHRLRILGADKGVFDSTPPGGLEKALAAFRDKKWDEMKAAAAASGMADSKAGRQLLDAYDRIRRGADFAVKAAEKNMQAFMPATAAAQLDEATLLLGVETPAVKALRAKLPANPKDSRRPEPPLAACNPAWPEAKLPGNDGGFACGPNYIAETNARGLDGMTPQQIARFLGHFNAGPAEGAAMALADQGEKALPLIDRLMHDTNPYIRAAAVSALAHMYNLGGSQQAQRKKGAVEIPADLSPVIAKLKSLADDKAAMKIGMAIIKYGKYADTHDLSKAYLALTKHKEDARAGIGDLPGLHAMPLQHLRWLDQGTRARD